MSRDRIDFWIEGEQELFVNMQRRIDGLSKAGRKALREGGMSIVADAKENLRNNGSVATGMLRASGKVQKVEGDPDAIDAGFFSTNTKNGYAYWVEYGRRAGGLPPVDEIAQWLRKKSAVSSGTKSAMKSAAAFMGKTPVDYVRHLAWAIARTIAKKGSKPHPFFAPAVERNRRTIVEKISEAIKQETERDGK